MRLAGEAGSWSESPTPPEDRGVNPGEDSGQVEAQAQARGPGARGVCMGFGEDPGAMRVVVLGLCPGRAQLPYPDLTGP